MKIELYDIDKIIPYVNNPRNNENAVDKVAASIKEFGFQQPIVIDKDNVVIVGHTRLLAANKIGLIKVPVVVAKNLTKAQTKAYRIADNKASEYAKWDNNLLKIELEQLEEMNFNLEELNIDFSDFKDLDTDLIDLPENLELEKEEQTNVMIKKLKFGTYEISLSDEEFTMLTALVEKYIEKTGVLLGFVQELVGGMFNDKK